MSSTTYSVLNFYKFVLIDHVPAFKLTQEKWARELKLKGSVLLATEGINAALSGSPESLNEYCKRLIQDPRFDDVRFVFSSGTSQPFKRFKVKVKDYIVVFPQQFAVKGDEIASAPYMSPTIFNEHLHRQSDDIVFIDTRNYYEVDYGTFESAQHLGITHFKEFPEKFVERYGAQKDKTYVMFCTGGIRCEKAAVFARKAGFTKTYQLDGGILKYFQEHGPAGWRGNLFVFDHRWSITPALAQGGDGPHPDQL